MLVDEVLAVGDLAFQKKCLGRMGDVAKRGRTVIFVSHQMNQSEDSAKESLGLIRRAERNRIYLRSYRRI